MFDRILVALDGSDTSSYALDSALRMARETHALLQPLYVIDTPSLAFDAPGFDPSLLRDAYVTESEQVIADALERMKRAGVAGTARVIEATLDGGVDVAHCIRQAALDSGATLIVMGTHGRRGVRRMMLGSVAEQTLRCAPCPVLLVPLRATQRTPASTAPAGEVHAASN